MRLLLDSIDTSAVGGLRDRALMGVMIYSFARVSAVVNMDVDDYYQQGKRWVAAAAREGRQGEWRVVGEGDGAHRSWRATRGRRDDTFGGTAAGAGALPYDYDRRVCALTLVNDVRQARRVNCRQRHLKDEEWYRIVVRVVLEQGFRVSWRDKARVDVLEHLFRRRSVSVEFRSEGGMLTDDGLVRELNRAQLTSYPGVLAAELHEQAVDLAGVDLFEAGNVGLDVRARSDADATDDAGSDDDGCDDGEDRLVKL